MNKNVERLYNGIIKENPTFVSDAWNVSYFGGYIICYQRTWYGAFYNCSIGIVQLIDLSVP